MKSFGNEFQGLRNSGGIFIGCVVALLSLMSIPGHARAENWEQVGTVPGSSFQIGGVNASGTVALSAGSNAYSWSKTGGLKPIGSADSGCSLDIAGISDAGVILGSQLCSVVVGSSYNYVRTLLAWTPDSANPSRPLAGDISADDIAPDGSFVATDHHGTGLDPTDDTVLTGNADIAPVTQVLLVGSAPAGPGYGISIAPDGTILTSKLTSNDGFTPPQFFRDSSPSGPYFVRSSETNERVFGLTPDERALARVAGASVDPDPATDTKTMKLMVYDRTTGSEVPLTGGGLTVQQGQNFLPGGGSKSIYATSVGTGVPPGQSAITAWSTPTSIPHTLPIYFDNALSGQPVVTPAASSANGQYLVLSNGEVWTDTEWEVGIQPPGALEIPDQVKKYAFEQQQYYEGQIGYWQTKQKVAVVGIGPLAAIDPVVLASLAIGVVGQGVEFSVAVKNRDYWATVSLDPPDPKWQTVASAPGTHIGRLRRPGSIPKKDFAKVTSYLEARLRFLANQICSEDALNRGATALDKDSPSKAKAQYLAGAKCSDRAVAAAKASKRLASKAAPVIDKSLLGIRKLKGRKKPVSKADLKKGLKWELGQLNRLIDLPASYKGEDGEFKELFQKIDKPISKKKVSSIKPRIIKAATHDEGTVGGIGQVGDAYEKAAD